MPEKPEDMSVLIVIPTYQESANIESILERTRTVFPDGSILVVDDNSPDGTAELAEKAGEKFGRIDVLRRPGKAGLGSAYRAGFAWGLAKGFDVLIEMDADFSHDPAAIASLVQGIEDGADLVVGSRYVPGGAIPGWPAHRALLSRYGNKYAKTILGLKLNDATAGYRAFRASILERIDYPTVRADGYGFQIEMAYRVTRAGGIIREVPITFVDRTEGESKMSGKIIVEALAFVTAWGVRDRALDALGLGKKLLGGRTRR